MGYTHYFSIEDPTQWEAAWPQLIEDANLLIELANIPLKQRPEHPSPTVEDGIWINGVQDDGHETFILSKFGLEHESGFCKTARKPYDLVVSTILMRAKKLGGEGFYLSSDGSWGEEDDGWVKAKEFYDQLWPEDKVTGDELGLYELTDEQKNMKEEAGVSVDERFIAAMFMKNCLGPVTALVNQANQGIPFTQEQLDFLHSPLPPLNPNKETQEDLETGKSS